MERRTGQASGTRTKREFSPHPIAIGVLVVAAWLVYRRIVSFSFLSWDDDIHITKNPYFDPLTFSGVLHFWFAPYENLYVPVSYTFWAGEVWLARMLSPGAALQPAVFHAGSLLLHVACVLLVYKLLFQLVKNPLAALAGALVFCVHPLQVESVAWIGETRGLLSTLLALVALDRYLAADQATRARNYLLATLAFVLAVLAKPSAVALPLVVLALELCWYRRPLARSLEPLLAWLAIALVIVIGTKLNQSDARIAFKAPLVARPLVAGDALAFYLQKTVVPLRLGFDYGRSPQAVMQSWSFYFRWLIPCALLALLSLSKDYRAWLAAAGVFVAALLPTLGFVPFLYQDISTVADRYIYLPMLGVSLALAAWLARHPRPLAFTACGFMLGAWGCLSAVQAGYWSDDMTLYDRGLQVNPRSYVAEYSLGNVYYNDQRFREARVFYEAALALNPQHSLARNNLGATLLQLGHVDEAIRQLHLALEANPDFAGAHVNLGNAYSQKHEPVRAAGEYRDALRLDPRSFEAHLDLGDILLDAQDLRGALAHYREAARLRPSSAEAHFKLGLALAHLREFVAAEQELRLSLRLNQSLSAAHDNLALLYWMQDRRPEAAREYMASLALNPQQPLIRVYLGKLFAELNQKGRALDQFQQALAMLPHDSPEAGETRAAIEALETRPEADGAASTPGTN